MSGENNEYTSISKSNEISGGNNSTTVTIPLQDVLTDACDASLFEALPQGVLHYDTNGRILRANATAQHILGMTLAQLHNSPPSLVPYDENGRPLRENEGPVRRILAGATLQNTTSVDIIMYGSTKHEQRNINVSGAPMYDISRCLCGAIIILQDVTEQCNANQRTQRSLDAILAMATAVVQEDHDPTETVKNDERDVSGAPRDIEAPMDDITGRRLLELPCRLLDCQRGAIVQLDSQTQVLTPVAIVSISPEYEQHWRNSLHGARLSSLLGNAELVERLHAGETLSLDATHQLFRDLPSYKLIVPISKGSKLIGILLLAYGSIKPDLTIQDLAIIRAIADLSLLVIEREKAVQELHHAAQKLQMASDELERASKVKSDFLLVSHEFRTALTGIQGFSEIMRDKDLSMYEMKEFAVDIHTDARRLVRLITDVLTIDRMEAPHLQLNLTWVDLNGIIIDVVGRIRQANAGLAIRLQLANVLPILSGDYEKLSSVVTNLLQNAMLHSPLGSEIAISSQVEGNVIHVCVRDYGMGLSPAELERIFEHPARSATNSGLYIEGTQPELSIAREIIQVHGGQAWAESAPGKGSLFHFTVRFTDSH